MLRLCLVDLTVCQWCRGRLPVGGPDSGQLDSVLGGVVGIDCCWERHLRERCCPCIIECITSASMCIFFIAKLCCIRTWSKIVIFYIFRALNLWFVCVYFWILALPRILWRDPNQQPIILRWGCYICYQSRVKVKCMLTNLKNDQQYFYGGECVLLT
jgi:hypothetical protein